MENVARTIDALTSMIAINNKRASAYQSLSEKTHQHEIKIMLRQFADQSKRFAGGLSTWRAAYGGFGVVDKKSSVSAWFQVRNLLGLNSEKNMITECEELEQDAIKVYKESIAIAFMPRATEADLEKQIREFEKALLKLRSVKDQCGVQRELVAGT